MTARDWWSEWGTDDPAWISDLDWFQLHPRTRYRTRVDRNGFRVVRRFGHVAIRVSVPTNAVLTTEAEAGFVWYRKAYPDLDTADIVARLKRERVSGNIRRHLTV